MYNLKLNNFHLNPKNSTIYTPKEVSEFLFNLLKDKISKEGFILDPCFGRGSLLIPWTPTYPTFGIDNDPQAFEVESYGSLETDFLQLTRPFTSEQGKDDGDKANLNWLNNNNPALILCNPPFNGYKRKLACEVWLDKIIELFGKEVPMVLFVPMGFRLNSKSNGKRWSKFNNNHYPPISSIISLPLDIFTNVEFHTEILIFNIKDLQEPWKCSRGSKITSLQPHYFFKHYE